MRSLYNRFETEKWLSNQATLSAHLKEANERITQYFLRIASKHAPSEPRSSFHHRRQAIDIPTAANGS